MQKLLSGMPQRDKENGTKQKGVDDETSRNDQNRDIRRAQPSFRALREIRFYQKSTYFLIPMRAFQRAVRQVVLDINGKDHHWQARALFATPTSHRSLPSGLLGGREPFGNTCLSYHNNGEGHAISTENVGV